MLSRFQFSTLLSSVKLNQCLFNNISDHSFVCFRYLKQKPINRQINTFNNKSIFLSKHSYNPFLLCVSNENKLSSIDQSIRSFSITKEITQKSNQSSQELNTDSEQLEKEKQRIRQQKITKYTLLVMLCMFSGCAIYALLEWGKPPLDEDGNVIEDQFSQIPIPMQYVYRTWHTFTEIPIPMQYVYRARDILMQIPILMEYVYKAWNTFTHYGQVLNTKKSTAEPAPYNFLLPPPLQPPNHQPPYTLVIEMIGVLLHPDSTHKSVKRYKIRPYVDYFLKQCATSANFEVVIHASEYKNIASPIVDCLDPNGFIMYRIFKDSTHSEDETDVKDLSRLNRDLSKVIHINWNKDVCKLNPNNCLTLSKWDGSSNDQTLHDLAQFLKAITSEGVEDVRDVIQYYSQFDDPLEAFKENERKLAEEKKEKLLSKLRSTLPGPLFSPRTEK